jgi:predicted DNA-binding transcriptional regulator AlpA
MAFLHVTARVGTNRRFVFRTTDSLGTAILKLLDLDEIGTVLGRSPETIKKDLRRNPMAVPPRLHIPGTRLLRWRECDVDAWLAEHVVRGAR